MTDSSAGTQFNTSYTGLPCVSQVRQRSPTSLHPFICSPPPPLRLNHCLSVRPADHRCWNTPVRDVMCSRLRKTETVKLSSTFDATVRAVSLFCVCVCVCVSSAGYESMGLFFMNLNYLCFDYFCWCIVSHVMKDSNEQLSLKNTN